MIRVAWLDVDARFVNPTRSLLPAALAMGCDVSFFGPGHVTSERLARGLAAFLDETGPYDVVAANSHVVHADIVDPPPDERAFRRHYAFRFPGADLARLPEIARALGSVSLPRVGVFLESDYYNWSAAEIDRVDARLDAVVGFAPPFWGPRSAMPHLADESFASRATDAWSDWVARNAHRAVPMLPMIDARELAFAPLAQRTTDWTILGIGYAARAEAARRLSQAGLSPVPSTRLRRALGALKRFGVLRGETDLAIDLLNRDFYRRLAASRYSYTCGSGLGMPIRKFFEIPAAGAVLVCRPFFGFAEAGFADGVNAIVCEPQDVLDAHRQLEADPQRAQEIADAGRRLVARRHSVAARAGQLRAILERAAQRRPLRSAWRDGELRLGVDEGALP